MLPDCFNQIVQFCNTLPHRGLGLRKLTIVLPTAFEWHRRNTTRRIEVEYPFDMKADVWDELLRRLAIFDIDPSTLTPTRIAYNHIKRGWSIVIDTGLSLSKSDAEY